MWIFIVTGLWLRRQVEDLSRECIDLKRAAAPPATWLAAQGSRAATARRSLTTP